MQILIKIVFFAFLLLHSACSEDQNNPHEGDYLLSLSWSPTYCLLNAKGSRDNAQCRKRKKDYRLIVHGLWKQPKREMNSKADHLRYCQTDAKRVSGQIINSIFDIMPSSGLINHTWRKHGTCSNMSQKEYFGKIASLYKDIKVGAMLQDVTQSKIMHQSQILQNILKASKTLKKENVIVTCRKRIFHEVRICFDHTFGLRKCRLDERRSECRGNKINVPFEGIGQKR